MLVEIVKLQIYNAKWKSLIFNSIFLLRKLDDYL